MRFRTKTYPFNYLVFGLLIVAALACRPNGESPETPGPSIRMVDLSVVTDSAATGNYSNAWGGHQPRVVRTSDGIVYTEYIVPVPGNPEARQINIVRRDELGWEVIDTIPIGGTPGHLLVDPGDTLHLVVWAGSDGEFGLVELWSMETGSSQFARQQVPGDWHAGDPLYGGAGIAANGSIYVVACFGGGEPGGHFEWNSLDVSTGEWGEFSTVELDFRYAYPYVLPDPGGGFSIVAGRDITWEALGYDRPCPDCQYAFDAVGTWSYAPGAPLDTFGRVDIHEEVPTADFPNAQAFSNYSGDAYLDSRGRLHVIYTVVGGSTGGEWVVRHAIVDGGEVLMDQELPGDRGEAGAMIEDSEGRLYLVKYFMDTSPTDAELVVYAAQDELGSQWGDPTHLSLDGHVVRYSGITLAAPRGGTGLADYVDGAYPSGTSDGSDWVYFRVLLK